MHDYGARFYDPAVGRFTGVDPLAEHAPDWTPFRYGFNNPLIFIDPDGLFESRKEAREYRRGNDHVSGKIRKQDDGSFAIQNNRTGVNYQDFGSDLGVLAFTTVTPTDIVDAQVSDENMLVGTQRDGEVRDLMYVGLHTGTAPGPGKIFKAVRNAKKGLEIGRKAIKMKEAIRRLKKGEDIFTTSRSAAKKAMKKASGGGKVIKDKAHGKGYFDHFHDKWRKLKSHAFFGKPKT